MANAMTQRQRSWLKDNFIGLLIIAMIAGYFTYDIQDKKNNRDDHKDFQKDISDLKAITYNLVEAYGGKVAKDAEQDKEILDLWKCQKRSGNQTQLLK
jgi:ribosomal protein S17E